MTGNQEKDNTGKVTITADELNLLPLKAYDGKVHVITETKNLSKVYHDVINYPVVGFDTETRPSFKKGQSYKVALIQLAVPGKVYLIRTHHTGLTDEFNGLFESAKLVKAGVAIRDDIKALHAVRPFRPDGFVDLSVMARQVGLQVESVKKLAGLILGFRISKSAQTSNWEAPTLTEKQIEYAATDAWVCLELYEKLRHLLPKTS